MNDVPRSASHTANQLYYIRQGGVWALTNGSGGFTESPPANWLGNKAFLHDAETAVHTHADETDPAGIGFVAAYATTNAPQLFPYVSNSYTAPAEESRAWVRIDDDLAARIMSLENAPPAGAPTISRHEFDSHDDFYTASSTNPRFDFPYPDGTDVDYWRAAFVTGYLSIDSRISSLPTALGGGRGWPLTKTDAAILQSYETEDFGVKVTFSSTEVRLTLQGFGSIPTDDRNRFTLDLTAIS